MSKDRGNDSDILSSQMAAGENKDIKKDHSY